MYFVVFKTVVGSYQGVNTWSSFADKAKFDEWYDDKMKSSYLVVEEGVSEERAVELCSTKSNRVTGILAEIKEATSRLTS